MSYSTSPANWKGNADGLSRLPAPTTEFQVPMPAETVLSMTVLDYTPVTSSSVAQWSRRDPVLALVLKYVQAGWPNDVHSDYQAYYRRRSELSIIDGCLLLGSRVDIPPQGQETLLEELHFSHLGITRMKSLARSYVWWPSIDAEIELKVRSCEPCQATQKSPALQPLHPWEWPGKPWTRLHIDYSGSVEGRMLLVIIDSHNKYIDVHAIPSATSTATIRKLHGCFARHGLPQQQLVSDNREVSFHVVYSTPWNFTAVWQILASKLPFLAWAGGNSCSTWTRVFANLALLSGWDYWLDSVDFT